MDRFRSATGSSGAIRESFDILHPPFDATALHIVREMQRVGDAGDAGKPNQAKYRSDDGGRGAGQGEPNSP